MSKSIAELLVEDVRVRLLEENIPRILKCLGMVNESQLHLNLNSHTNSIAQLIVHLDGNCRQWLISSFTDKAYERERSSEFGNQSHENIASLTLLLERLINDLDQCLKLINEEQLKNTFHIQNFICSGVAVVIHVTEHFSYHTGQIAQLTKIIVNQATLFYDDSVLNVS